MFYHITLVNWRHFIPTNDKGAEGNSNILVRQNTIQVQQPSILMSGIENAHVKKRPTKHKHINVSIFVQYWFYLTYYKSQTTLQRTVAITCKPLEHISQGKYLLMALLSEVSLE